MRRCLLWSVGLVYAVAWFVQVVKDGELLAQGTLPGWQALRFALGPLWGDSDGNFLRDVLSVSSGLTNILFVLGFVQLARSQSPHAQRWSRMLFVAAAINTSWIIDLVPLDEMRAGYWLWLASFALLGLVARMDRA